MQVTLKMRVTPVEGNILGTEFYKISEIPCQPFPGLVLSHIVSPIRGESTVVSVMSTDGDGIVLDCTPKWGGKKDYNSAVALLRSTGWTTEIHKTPQGRHIIIKDNGNQDVEVSISPINGDFNILKVTQGGNCTVDFLIDNKNFTNKRYWNAIIASTRKKIEISKCDAIHAMSIVRGDNFLTEHV